MPHIENAIHTKGCLAPENLDIILDGFHDTNILDDKGL